jgi:hypothetical protein
MLEIVEDRHNRGSTIVSSQLTVDHWHDAMANPRSSIATATPSRPCSAASSASGVWPPDTTETRATSSQPVCIAAAVSDLF